MFRQTRCVSLRSLVVLLALSAFATGSFVAASETDVDLVFRQLAEGGKLVLQANFGTDKTPAIPTCLFGTSDQDAIILRFSRLVTAKVLLNGVEVPEAGKGAIELAATADRTAGVNHWQLKFTISADKDFPATVGPALEIQVGSQPQTLQAYLGDAWLVVGSQNVGMPEATPAPNQGDFAIGWVPPSFSAPTKPATLLLPTVTYVPSSSVPQLPGFVPSLGTRLAVELGRALGRPQMVVSVWGPRKKASDWIGSSLAPLNGWNGQRAETIGIRGIIWWVGDNDAESDDFPEPLPDEIGEKLRIYRYQLDRWQGQRRRQFSQALLSVADKALGREPSPSLHGNDSALAGLVLLIVQTQSVWRQSQNFDRFTFAPASDSSWELVRAAQLDVARDWRALGFRTLLVPALADSNSAALAQARWLWRDPTSQSPLDLQRKAENDERYQTLAVRLSQAAQAGIGSLPGDLPPNLPQITFSAAEATIKIGGSSLVSSAPKPARLEYLTLQDPSAWKPWTGTLAASNTIAEPNHTVIGVRYASGDWPGPLHSVNDANGSTIGLLPAFETLKPVLP